jgi:hypothetical protein
LVFAKDVHACLGFTRHDPYDYERTIHTLQPDSNLHAAIFHHVAAGSLGATFEHTADEPCQLDGDLGFPQFESALHCTALQCVAIGFVSRSIDAPVCSPMFGAMSCCTVRGHATNKHRQTSQACRANNDTRSTGETGRAVRLTLSNERAAAEASRPSVLESRD